MTDQQNQAIEALVAGGYDVSQATEIALKSTPEQLESIYEIEAKQPKPYAAIMGLLLVGVVGFGVYALANAGKKKSLSGHRKKKGKK